MPRSCARAAAAASAMASTSYKSNRREKLKPWGYRELVDWVLDTYPVIQIDNVETDDILGSCYLEGDVIVSGDKDMKTIPVLISKVSWSSRFQRMRLTTTSSCRHCTETALATPRLPRRRPSHGQQAAGRGAKPTAIGGRWCSPPIARKALMSSMPSPRRGWLASSGLVNTTTMRVNQSFGFPLFNCLLITRP